MTLRQLDFGLPLENILFAFLSFYENKMVVICCVYAIIFYLFELKKVSVPCKEE